MAFLIETIVAIGIIYYIWSYGKRLDDIEEYLLSDYEDEEE